MAELIDAVSAIAAEAGALALRRAGETFEQWEKHGGEPVSDVDLEVDALLRTRLSALMPDAGWLSEETADSADRLGCQRVWVVDPIDGTRDFLRGRAGWAVSIALVDAGRVVLGVLDAPVRGDHWRALAGGGAWRNGMAVRCGQRERLDGARVPADSLPRPDADLVLVEKPNSIALRIAKVAADEADLVATLRWGHEWDVAAATLIAAEAGARVSDALGAPLVFNTPSAQAFGVVVSTPGIHPAAIDRLADRARALAGH